MCAPAIHNSLVIVSSMFFVNRSVQHAIQGVCNVYCFCVMQNEKHNSLGLSGFPAQGQPIWQYMQHFVIIRLIEIWSQCCHTQRPLVFFMCIPLNHRSGKNTECLSKGCGSIPPGTHTLQWIVPPHCMYKLFLVLFTGSVCPGDAPCCCYIHMLRQWLVCM